MSLMLYNTLTRKKEPFRPLDPANVRMYVCGPTVYDYAHIGNARPVIVFDVLFRLLRHHYGADHVTYVRNITDVDDKINARAREEGVPIGDLTERTTKQFHDDIAALGVLPPTVEPRATGHIAEMIVIIEKLIAKGHAYAADGHVLFDVPSMEDYGRLSRRPLDEMIAGARVDVAPYKRGDMDFVLWKPSDAETPGWDSPWGRGRPGWHIECSAMSWKHLGEKFDIHGGGIDLVFPHHENEVAQTRCAFGHDVMANIWMHNGFLQVEGQKMSKSLGNFVTINELLNTTKFGALPWTGDAIRLATLMSHYRQPLDWTAEKLAVAGANLHTFHLLGQKVFGPDNIESLNQLPAVLNRPPSKHLLGFLEDDLNTSSAVLTHLFGLVREADQRGGIEPEPVIALLRDCAFLGLDPFRFAKAERDTIRSARNIETGEVDDLIVARITARKAKNWAEGDRIRDELAAMGIAIKDNKDGTTSWEVKR
ncbi:MAG: cysteine--tRNA ligase [Rhizobiales bacterium]|nr:cysteine--tRNA ligase [Hyphomicrobiales bacterium]